MSGCWSLQRYTQVIYRFQCHSALSLYEYHRTGEETVPDPLELDKGATSVKVSCAWEFQIVTKGLLGIVFEHRLAKIYP